MPRTTEVAAAGSRHPTEGEVLRELLIAALSEDRHRCLEVARSYLGLLDACDSPLVAASASRIGFQALAIADSTPDAQSALLLSQATRQLQRARRGLTDEWHGSFSGVQLALAEGYAARTTRKSGVEHFREAAMLAGPFGSFFALEPRLDLAQELLANGGRDEGRELLVDCWTAAHDMGARGLEQRAFRLATRARVPLPESATSEGPLSRLTPREREVIQWISAGKTSWEIGVILGLSERAINKFIADAMVKLDAATRAQAVANAIRIGEIEL
jgi:DNA-binding CsgD family transcriptional regulator